MNNSVGYVLTRPWPKVGRQEPNRALVRNIFTVYAGPNGELTTIGQYFYNSLVARESTCAGLSELYSSVSSDSMHHIQRLGQLILQFGGDPQLLSYQSGRPIWWTSSVLTYQRDPDLMLAQSVELVRRLLTLYRNLSGMMQGEPKALIDRIIEDEEHHLELFQRARVEMCGRVPEKPPIFLPEPETPPIIIPEPNPGNGNGSGNRPGWWPNPWPSTRPQPWPGTSPRPQPLPEPEDRPQTWPGNGSGNNIMPF